MTSLYQLSNEMRELQAMAEDDDPGFAEALTDTLQAYDEQAEEKIEATLFVAKELESDADACENEIKRLQERAKRLRSNAATCKQRVLDFMVQHDKSKIKRPLLSITVTKGRAVAEIENEALLPEQYVKTKTTTAPDRVAILKALKDGEMVLGAKLGKGKPSLRIS